MCIRDRIYMGDARCLCEIDPEEVRVQPLDRFDLRIRSGNVREFRCIFFYEIYGGELRDVYKRQVCYCKTAADVVY